MLGAHAALKKINAKAYLEFHIEQGGVLESQNKSTGVVLGTFGLQRHMLRFVGQAAHAGATPINMRRDAFLAAASTALECREIARRHSKPGAGVVCTTGVVKVEPGFVTAIPAPRKSRWISVRSTRMSSPSWFAKRRKPRAASPRK